MDSLKDSIFGDMVFKHGWNKEEKINFWNKEMVLKISAAAYTGEGIDEIQRKNYKDFIDNKMDISQKSLQAVRQYVEDNREDIEMYVQTDTSLDNVRELVSPKKVLFKKDGSYGILCDCKWDIEHGLVIKLPEYKVGPQDIFL
jgi:hypothetical protein